MQTELAAKKEEKKATTLAPVRGAVPGAVTSAPAGMPLFLQMSPVQAKLAIGQPDDVFEKEADEVANAVLNRDRRGESIRRNDVVRQPGNPLPPKVPSTVIPLPDAGSPLPSNVRQKIEPVLGVDTSHIRVHTSPQAGEVARGLQAKAFTHRNHIWIGPGRSPEDLALIAHESAHVVQQEGQGGADIQRKPDELPRTEDGEEVRRKLQGEVDRATGETGSENQPHYKDGGTPHSTRIEGTTRGGREVNPTQLAALKTELQPKAQPSIDRSAEQRPHVEEAARAVKEEADKPPALTQVKGQALAGKGASGTGPRDPSIKAARIAEQAFTAADSEALPEPHASVVMPALIRPVDAGGKSLALDPFADQQITRLAGSAQVLRTYGYALRERAAEERADAGIIRGNIHIAEAGMIQAEAGIARASEHVTYRRGVLAQARGVLEVSQQKADMVAEQAPIYQEKGERGKGKSGPMASESKDLVAQNSSKTLDDEDAAAKSSEQTAKMNQVSSDIGTMDDAFTQTKVKSEELSKEAVEAKQTNAQTQARIDMTEATLAETEGRLDEMSGQNLAARVHIAELAGRPSDIVMGAVELDRRGMSLVEASFIVEQRLHQTQQDYAQGMRSVPISSPGGGSAVVQRQAESGEYAGRINLNLGGRVADALPSWLTGEDRVSEERRRQTEAQENQRRRDEIAEINRLAGDDFDSLSAGGRASIALKLTTRHLFNSVATTDWPDFAGKMVQGFYDPRVSLMGIVSGLSMVLSGGANLFSAEQWQRDPLGNLYKSAADIATGITIVLGSITLLAVATLVILTALAIFTFGALGPVAGFFWSFLPGVISVVGGWTLWAAAIALELQGIVFIKNLIDAATAKSARDLQAQADEMTEDAKNAGNMAMQLGVAKVMEVGGKALGNTSVGQVISAEARTIGEDFNIIKPPAPTSAPPVLSGEGVAQSGVEATSAPAIETVPAATQVEMPSVPKPAETIHKPSMEQAPVLTQGEASPVIKPVESAHTPVVGEAPISPKMVGELNEAPATSNLVTLKAANVTDYLTALRNETHPAGSVGRAWDYNQFPRPPKGEIWKVGDPIDMPSSKGDYPTFDTARTRYWRNRAHYELEARLRGEIAAKYAPNSSDPIHRLSDSELNGMRIKGKAPEAPGFPGMTMELEHSGVPQRVGKWLNELGFSQQEARALAQVSNPGAVMEVTPLEHAFFDVEAHSFGSQRADITGKQWSGTSAADVRGQRPLEPMSNATIQRIAQEATTRNYNFNATQGTRQLLDALRLEIAHRGLPIKLP